MGIVENRWLVKSLRNISFLILFLSPAFEGLLYCQTSPGVTVLQKSTNWTTMVWVDEELVLAGEGTNLVRVPPGMFRLTSGRGDSLNLISIADANKRFSFPATRTRSSYRPRIRQPEAYVKQTDKTERLLGLVLADGTSLAAIAETAVTQAGRIRVPNRAEVTEMVNAVSNRERVVRLSSGRVEPRLPSKPKKTFVPIPLVDPRTNVPMKPSELINLPNGRRLTAKRYVEELNAIERELNDRGYSLRDPQDEYVIAAPKPGDTDFVARQEGAARTVHSIPHPPAKFDGESRYDTRRPLILNPTPSQTNVLSSMSDVFVPPNIRSWCRDPRLPLDQNLMNDFLSKMSPSSSAYRERWGWEYGRFGFLESEIEGMIHSYGQVDKVTLDPCTADVLNREFTTQGTIYTKGSLTLFDDEFQLFRADVFVGDYHWTDTDVPRVHSRLEMFGQTTVENTHDIAPISGSGELTAQIVGIDGAYYFSIMGIPLSIRWGVVGSVGLDYSGSLSEVGYLMHQDSYATANLWVEIGVDIYIGGAGAGSDLTLLDARQEVFGNLSVEVDNTGKAYWDERFAVDESLEMMAGRVYAYAYVYTFWGKKSRTWNIWDWRGFKTEERLIDHNEHVYLER